jgi:hypothetical protein
MLVWLLLGAALAAEPDLSGVNVALGVGWSDAVELPGLVTTPRVSPLVRLHLGRHVLAELSAGAGRTREQDLRETWEPDEESEPFLTSYDEYRIEGWRWTAGGRLAVRVGGEAVHHYVGLAGTAGRGSAVGPWYQEVPTEDLLGQEPAEVGERTETDREYGVAVGWTAVHWVTDRISLSAGLDLPIYGVDHREIDERSDGTVPDLRETHDVDREEELGGAPVARLALHLRL